MFWIDIRENLDIWSCFGENKVCFLKWDRRILVAFNWINRLLELMLWKHVLGTFYLLTWPSGQSWLDKEAIGMSLLSVRVERSFIRLTLIFENFLFISLAFYLFVCTLLFSFVDFWARFTGNNVSMSMSQCYWLWSLISL